MKGIKTTKLAASMVDIAARSPFETLGAESRYIIVADLRMGDGGRKDELAIAKKSLFAILGRWYLPRGYTLVLNGDVEDLRGFWLKDILAAWPEMYALFDVFAERGRLRKILGDRDLGLLRLASYPYELSHGLRLDGERNSVLVLHGHQATPPYSGRDYLSDYIQHWLGSSKRSKPGILDETGRERFKAEQRLYRAASSLGMVTIQGHTRRPLFESLTNRDSVRAEVERLLREGDPLGRGSTVDALVDVYRRESRKGAPARPYARSGAGYDERAIASPCLFCPGRVLGARSLRVLEIEGDSLRLARWARAEGRKAGRKSAEPLGPASPAVAPQRLEGSPYARFEIRSSSIRGLLERVDLLASSEGKEGSGGKG
jgi:hypothetical protein